MQCEAPPPPGPMTGETIDQKDVPAPLCKTPHYSRPGGLPSILYNGTRGVIGIEKQNLARQRVVTELKAPHYCKLKLRSSCGAGIQKSGPERVRANMLESMAEMDMENCMRN